MKISKQGALAKRKEGGREGGRGGEGAIPKVGTSKAWNFGDHTIFQQPELFIASFQGSQMIHARNHLAC